MKPEEVHALTETMAVQKPKSKRARVAAAVRGLGIAPHTLILLLLAGCFILYKASIRDESNTVSNVKEYVTPYHAAPTELKYSVSLQTQSLSSTCFHFKRKSLPFHTPLCFRV